MGDVRKTYAHQQARKDALTAMVDGTPCPYCHRPMHIWQRLQLDHAIPVAKGGSSGPTRLAHGKCNESAGARLGNRMRRNKRRVVKRRALPKW